jgi:hypothetical protein
MGTLGSWELTLLLRQVRRAGLLHEALPRRRSEEYNNLRHERDDTYDDDTEYRHPKQRKTNSANFQASRSLRMEMFG